MSSDALISALYKSQGAQRYLDASNFDKAIWDRVFSKYAVGLEKGKKFDVDDPIRFIELFIKEINDSSDERFINALGDYFSDIDKRYLYNEDAIKLLLISLMYQYNKNDFDNYKAFLDDIMKIKFGCNIEHYLSGIYGYVYEELHEIFKNPCYKDIPFLRDILKKSNKFFKVKHNGCSYYRIEECNRLMYINSILSGITDYDVLKQSYDLLLDYSFNDLDRPDSLSRFDYFFESVSRKNMFFSNLFKFESNIHIHKEFLNLIKGLSNGMFRNLDNVLECDSFDKLFGIIFDSDSYVELYNNLYALESANHMYLSFSSDVEWLERIKKMGDISIKDKYNGKVIMYPKGCINEVVKPDKLVDRMKVLYSRVDDRFDYDFLDRIHDSSTSVFSICDKVNIYLSNPFNLIKGKIKRKKKEKV